MQCFGLGCMRRLQRASKPSTSIVTPLQLLRAQFHSDGATQQACLGRRCREFLYRQKNLSSSRGKRVPFASIPTLGPPWPECHHGHHVNDIVRSRAAIQGGK